MTPFFSFALLLFFPFFYLRLLSYLIANKPPWPPSDKYKPMFFFVWKRGAGLLKETKGKETE